MQFPISLPNKPIILASASPRRKELLAKICVEFKIEPSEFDENSVSFGSPTEMVKQLALHKAQDIAQSHQEAIVIGADTTVVLGNKILGKPTSFEHAYKMLWQLSGNTHQVYTGFAIVDQPSGRSVVEVEKTDVTFRKLYRNEIEAYVRTGEAMDKAGAYGIQDFSAIFSSGIDGCFYNVVGFPLTKFYVTFKQFLRVDDE